MELIIPQRTLDNDESMQGRQPASLTEVARSILTVDEDYCVINKPPAVRMDGNFPVTIDRLVASWIETDVKTLKWVHQLDFATSGALCIALNREAAAAAVSAFEHRTVRKNYLAMLQGHVDVKAWSLPEQYNNSDHQTFEDRLMNDYRIDLQATNKKAKRKIAEVDFDKNNILLWQASVMEQNLRSCLTAFASYNPPDNLSPELLLEYNTLKTISEERYCKGNKLRKQLRRFLSKVGVHVTIIDSSEEQAAANLPEHITNRFLNAPNSEEDDNSRVLPLTAEEVEIVCQDYRLKPQSIFRLPSITTNTDSETNLDRLVIDVPVAELDNDFRMEPGHDRNPGLRAVTILHVLEHGFYQGHPVTKVLFQPISGRRHQLRIHALCLGHPIVGDYTYNQFHRQAIFNAHNTVEKSAKVVAERMMLHAHKLTIPFPNFGKCSLPFKRKWLLKQIMKSSSNGPPLSEEKNKSKIDSMDPATLRATEVMIPLVDVVADDPFMMVDGELKPVLPSYMQIQWKK